MQLLKACKDYWPLKRGLMKNYNTYVSKKEMDPNFPEVLEEMTRDLADIAEKYADSSQANSSAKYQMCSGSCLINDFALHSANYIVLPCVNEVLDFFELAPTESLVDSAKKLLHLNKTTGDPAKNLLKRAKIKYPYVAKPLVLSGATKVNVLAEKIRGMSVVMDLELAELASLMNINSSSSEASALRTKERVKSFITYLLTHKEIASNQAGLKFIREMIENRDTIKSAVDWDPTDWVDCRKNVRAKQNFIVELDIIKPLCNLFLKHKSIKYEVLQCCSTMVLGGNRLAQDKFYEYFVEKDNTFVKELASELAMVCDHLQEGTDKQILHASKALLATCCLIKELCEGHRRKMQLFFHSANFIEVFSNIKEDFMRIMKDNIRLGEQLIDTFTEMVQGTCKENQTQFSEVSFIHFAKELIANLMNRKFQEENGILATQETGRLIRKTVTFMLSLLEGRPEKESVRRITETLDLERLKERLCQVFNNFVEVRLDIKLTEATTLKEINKKIVKNSFKGPIEEGFEIFILISKISYFSKQQLHAWTSKQALALSFFKKHTAHIKVVADDIVQRIYFPIPPSSKYFSEHSKKKLMHSIDRTDASTKIVDFLSQAPDIIDEMNHDAKLGEMNFKVTVEKYDLLRMMQLFLLLGINVLLILFYEERNASSTVDVPSWINPLLTALGVLHLAINCVAITNWLVLNGKLVIKKGLKAKFRSLKKKEETLPETYEEYYDSLKLVQKGFNSCLVLLSNLNLVFFCIVIFLSPLGLTYPIAYSVLLLDVIYRFNALRNVLKAVVLNGNQLLLTAMLGLIIIYIYAFWASSSTLTSTSTTVSGTTGRVSVRACGTASSLLSTSGLGQAEGLLTLWIRSPTTTMRSAMRCSSSQSRST
jgi:hypothetical protein